MHHGHLHQFWKWIIDWILIDTTTTVQSGSGSNGNKGILHTSQIFPLCTIRHSGHHCKGCSQGYCWLLSCWVAAYMTAWKDNFQISLKLAIVKYNLDWLILTVCQLVWDYVMPTSYGIAFIVRLFFFVYCCFYRDFAYSYMVSSIPI